MTFTKARLLRVHPCYLFADERVEQQRLAQAIMVCACPRCGKPCSQLEAASVPLEEWVTGFPYPFCCAACGLALRVTPCPSGGLANGRVWRWSAGRPHRVD